MAISIHQPCGQVGPSPTDDLHRARAWSPAEIAAKTVIVRAAVRLSVTRARRRAALGRAADQAATRLRDRRCSPHSSSRNCRATAKDRTTSAASMRRRGTTRSLGSPGRRYRWIPAAGQKSAASVAGAWLLGRVFELRDASTPLSYPAAKIETATIPNRLKLLADPARFELTTSAFGGQRSIQLS
jgi:hypothetical protein